MSTLRSALVASLVMAGALTPVACKKKQEAPGGGILSGIVPGAAAANADATKLFSDGPGNLMKALTEPTTGLAFSYKAQAQINPKYPHEAGSKPEVGPLGMEATVSADELSFETTRGDKKQSGKAKKSDEMAWAMSKLAFLGPVTNVSLTLAFAASVAKPSGTEQVGGSEAQVFTFDTRTADAAQKAALTMALGMLGGKTKLEHIHGTCAVDKTARRLVKFNFDVAFKDERGNAWSEHHEGSALPK